MSDCECHRLPNTFYLDEAPEGWLGGLAEVATGNWKTLRRCSACRRCFSIDASDKFQDRVAAQIDDLQRWEQEADSIARRRDLLLRSRGGTEAGECAWAGCAGARVRGVVYCLEHLWSSGARR